METKGSDEIWLIEVLYLMKLSSSTLNIVRVMTVFPVLGVLFSVQFYAPWCSFCKQLDPVWHEIGSELRSLGSMVQVGKSDATVSTGV